ncbi:MAG: hypothetical protein ACHQE5_13375 [Actinomycetes bacterium]
MTNSSKTAVRTPSAEAVYGLGLIGALVYYWQHASGFWPHIWAVVEAILWPAFVVYDLLAHMAH